MSNEIKGVSDTLAQVSDIAAKARKPEVDGANRTQALEPAPRDSVSLTDTAAKLRQLEGSLTSVPVVDPQRVSQVREAVSDGTYTVDTARVADKMVKFEGLLDEVGPSKG